MTYDQQLADYESSLAWVGRLIETTHAHQLDLPTPCSEFTVRHLIGHLIGTAYRGLGTATGVPSSVPHVVTNVSDDVLGTTYTRCAVDIIPAFAAMDAATPVVAPWGETLALAAVQGFTVETVTHGWDLATATARPPIAPPGVAERCLEFAAQVIPTRLRGVMYADAVPDQPGVWATERLAHLLGHR